MTARTRRLPTLALAGAVALSAGCGLAAGPHGPLAATRAGSAHALLTGGTREDKNGWIVVHVGGSPADRGQQLGRLLAAEIRGVLKIISQDDKTYWKGQRDVVTRVFAPKIT